VEAGRRDFYIMQKSASLEKGEFIYSYKAQLKETIADYDYIPNNYTGLTLQGTVLDVKNNLIKVHMEIDESQDKNTALWFPYVPEGSNMFYYMPEIGSLVKVYIPEKDISEVIGINTVRTTPANAGDSEWMASPETKLLSNQEKKFIALEPDQILVTPKQGSLHMTLSDVGGIQMESDTDIDIHAQKTVHLTDTKSLNISADTSIILQARDASSIYIGTDVQLSSEHVQIKGEDNSPIRALNSDGISLNSKEIVKETNRKLAPIDAAKAASCAKAVLPCQLDAKQDYSAVSSIVSSLPAQLNTVAGSGYSYEAVTQKGGTIEQESKPTGFNMVENQAATVIDPIKSLRSKTIALSDNMNAYNINVLKKAMNTAEKKGLHNINMRASAQYLEPSIRQMRFDPVDVTNGELIYEKIDFELDGIIPVIWKWRWMSHSLELGDMGHGIFHSYNMSLFILGEENRIVIMNEEGRGIIFPRLVNNQQWFHEREGCSLKRIYDQYQYHNLQTDLTYTFLVHTKSKQTHPLVKISNSTSFEVDLCYDSKTNQLIKIIDTQKREINIFYNDQHLIHLIEVDYGGITKKMASYKYNDERDLVNIQDALDNQTIFRYNSHLMIQRIDKDKTSFYWKYKDINGLPRVIKTWGEGSVMFGNFEYYFDAKQTKVTGLSKKPDKYRYNENGCVIHSLRSEECRIKYDYNQYFLPVLHKEGPSRITYEYNDLGCISKTYGSMEGTATYQFNEFGRMIRYESNSNSLQVDYDDSGRIQELVTNQGIYHLSYDSKGLVSELNSENGTYIFSYDKLGRLINLLYPEGNHERWDYDGQGKCIKYVDKENEVRAFLYDRLNRIIKETIKNSKDQKELRYTYDDQSNLTGVRMDDKEVHFAYNSARAMTKIEYEGKIQYKEKTDYKYRKQNVKKPDWLYQILQCVKGCTKTNALAELFLGEDQIVQLLKGKLQLCDNTIRVRYEEIVYNKMTLVLPILIGYHIHPQIFQKDMAEKN